jgi:hypothetical protein
MMNSSAICCTRAIEHFEFMGAFRCLYRSYHRRGLVTCSRPQQLRIIRHHLLPETRVFVARVANRVIGTLSLIEDRPLGVPLRSVFDGQVEAIARTDPGIAEAGCLAVDDVSSQHGLYIVHHLMGLAAQAASRRGMTQVVIAVHPRHAAFYERMAGFRRFAGPTPHPSVEGAPAVGLQLNLSTLREDFPQVWRRYFGMKFSSIALSTRPATPLFLRRMARLWQSLYINEHHDEPLPVRPYLGPSPSQTIGKAAWVRRFPSASGAGLIDRVEYANN